MKLVLTAYSMYNS